MLLYFKLDINYSKLLIKYLFLHIILISMIYIYSNINHEIMNFILLAT